MPADSAIKQLNLKTWAGKVKVVAPESSYLGTGGRAHLPPPRGTLKERNKIRQKLDGWHQRAAHPRLVWATARACVCMCVCVLVFATY